ncbi:hypothetical protein [Streptomyces sp. Rer75]|uniref:hypothetical protein n=1 Tax=unclassified Streptomyces TaxID=2593676 RepID=UPI0015D08EB9|nr:hypothetical protein [Streptomyces sp. Rer75]QLH24223.1 hypothetical protein HYQ63_29310 [Streptomyces sp. Rer75]
MTATAPSDGTSEPRPSAEGNTASEPSGQGGGSDEPSPPVPAQSPPQGPADAGSGASQSFEAIASQALGVDPGASRRKRTLWLSVTATVGLLSALSGTLLAYYMIKPSVTRENDSNKGYDASQAPFTVSVRPEEGEPREWAMVLDRELTADETQRLTSSTASSPAFAYLKKLGGHPLAYAPLLEHAPKRYTQQQTASGRLELSDTFKINVLSARAYGVVINDWKVTDVTCRKSTAKTVVFFPPQGGAAYQGIRLHIPPRADEPVLTDETEGQGGPYFDGNYIEVGGGQSSGGLRVEAIPRQGQSCEWGIKVHYSDVHQDGRWVQLKDRGGKPLRVRTESVPTEPQQKWVFGSVPWTPCHLKPKGELCDLA